MKSRGLDSINVAPVRCPGRCDKRLYDRGSRGKRGREREVKVKALGGRQWSDYGPLQAHCLDYSSNCGVPGNVCNFSQ